MKTRITIAIICIVALGYSACEKVKGKGEVVSQQNILDVIDTYIDNNNQLVIRYKKDVVVGSHEPIEIFIAAPALSSMNISGSGDIYATNAWNEPYLEAGISGSGNISIVEMNTKELQMKISGSGNFSATNGSIDIERLTISGSGNIDLVGVEADTSYITISGSGDVSVWAVDLLDVNISGSGNVKYKGNPVIVTKISGSGSIIKI